MDASGPAGGRAAADDRPIFISYATADRKEALGVCKAIERRRIRCWISTRDVAPGENYQEAIVRALRSSRAMVLVFSGAANNSDEIKKELSLASRYHVPLMALRIEDVEPSDAFAYELSTRQWIDAFEGWDKSIDSLTLQIRHLSAPQCDPRGEARAAERRPAAHPERRAAAIAALLVLPMIAAAGFWALRPAPTAAHSMTVRLAGFQRLSNDLPATLPDAVRDEIIAAFGDQGVVGASTAPTPPSGSAPAYALGGTIRRDGDQIRVITHLINERSGATLWSHSTNYELSQLTRVPRRIAVDAGNMARCGLFAASTYAKPLPDSVLADYMQYCETNGIFDPEPGKALDAAHKVVAAAPEFSSGWSAVSAAAATNLYASPAGEAREQVRREGLQAADRALSLDPRNSEAFAQKSMLIDPGDRLGQERLLKQAVAARPLDCGCEHVFYGLMLQNVGRYADSLAEFRRAVDMLALDANSQFTLADTLSVLGKKDEAKPHFDAAIDLSPNPGFDHFIALVEAPETRDYAAAIKALGDEKLRLPSDLRSASLVAFRALASGDASARANAVKALVALPRDQQGLLAVKLLAALGASHEALALFARRIDSRYDWPSLLWYPSMRGVLDDPGFPQLARRLGLLDYWRRTRTRPDVCASSAPPAFCARIS